MKLSTILKETKINQITGDLIRFEQDENCKYTNKIEGKCALGVLACESPDKYVHLSRKQTWIKYNEILESYGINDDKMFPYLADKSEGKDYNWDFDDCSANLSSIIIRLNDTYKLTFKQIGRFLELTFDL